jgi:hypothetical protein
MAHLTTGIYGESNIEFRADIVGQLSLNNINKYFETIVGIKNMIPNKSLKKLVIGTNITSIANGAFIGCHNLTGNLIIPDSVVFIGIGAFNSCGFDGTLTISNSIEVIKSSTFSGCSGFQGNLIIPNSVVEIESYAFYHCNGFSRNLILPKSLKKIGYCAFVACNVEFIIQNNDGCLSIDENAFTSIKIIEQPNETNNDDETNDDESNDDESNDDESNDESNDDELTQNKSINNIINVIKSQDKTNNDELTQNKSINNAINVINSQDVSIDYNSVCSCDECDCDEGQCTCKCDCIYNIQAIKIIIKKSKSVKITIN